MSRARIVVAALTLSAAAFVGITQREGFSERAYPDPVHGPAVPTIGFGSTDGVRMGDTITVPGALQRTLREVAVFEGALKACVTVPLHQHEYDAFIELSHNIGAAAFCGSTIVRRLNAGDYDGACEAILMWRRAGAQDCSAPGNRVCGGLWKDRLRVHAKCKGSA